MAVLFLVLPINFVLNYFLVINKSTFLGFKGAPIVISITYWLMFIFLFLYIKFIDGNKAWDGFDMKKSFEGWTPYIKLGVPGIFMICAQWWAFEIISLAIKVGCC